MVEKKLCQELALADDQGGQLEKLKAQSYLNKVIKEALRMYPPAWAVSRQAIQEDRVGDYIIPKGATVFLSIYAMHRDPSYWNEPDSFNPDRFQSKIDKQYYLPFGRGPRICIGNNFALLEMQIIVTQILQHFQITLESQRELELITPMTLCPKEPILFSLQKRKN